MTQNWVIDFLLFKSSGRSSYHNQVEHPEDLLGRHSETSKYTTKYCKSKFYSYEKQDMFSKTQ